MIVEQKGKNDVVVRYRDKNDKRQETVIKKYNPYCYVSEEDAQYIHGYKKTGGFTGVFGTRVVKVEGYDTWSIRELNKTGHTWEGNIPFTNQALTARVKSGEKPFESYNHRVWYLDGEWKINSGEITMLSVYDSFTERLYSWAVMPNIEKGKYKQMIDANQNRYTYETPVIVFDTEAELLSHFVSFMRKHDPDIITGWYVTGADIKQIITRCQKVGVRATAMSPMNKLRYEYKDWSQPIVGRNIIDLRLAFPKLYELKNGKLPNYKLDDVAWEALGEKKVELKDGHDTYYTDPVLYLHYNRIDVELLPKLDKLVNALEYFIAVQHIAQCEIRSTPHITQVFSCLALSDPQFKKQLPSEPRFEAQAYEGAIVMDGEKGVYDDIGIFDIKAMYHSNVALHNISWDTLYKDGQFAIDVRDCGNGTRFIHGADKKGLLVRQMDKMTVLRDHYKGLMKQATTEAERVRYDALQYATKSLVASMYGVAGDAKYGLYHPEIASAITYTSRATLMKLRDVAEDMGHRVVYGHTDSVMCEVESPEVGIESVIEMNKRMHPIIVQFEKWSQSFLLMEKNRYAGLVTWADGEYHEPKRYVKGIEMKQARMPSVMKNAMGLVIDSVLRHYCSDDVNAELGELIENIMEGKVPDEDLCMKGKLTKDLAKYTSVAGPAAGAQWANRTLGKGYRGGDYFLCSIDEEGNYIAFDSPSEIEGISKIGRQVMVERFIIKKVLPYYQVANWDISPLHRAMNGKSKVQWF
jgi:DNA polymerase elongation subunit (family B)